MLLTKHQQELLYVFICNLNYSFFSQLLPIQSQAVLLVILIILSLAPYVFNRFTRIKNLFEIA